MDRNLFIENILLLNPKPTHKTYGGKKKFRCMSKSMYLFVPAPKVKACISCNLHLLLTDLYLRVFVVPNTMTKFGFTQLLIRMSHKLEKEEVGHSQFGWGSPKKT